MLCTLMTEHDAKKSGSEVVKQVKSPLLSGLICPGCKRSTGSTLGVDFQLEVWFSAKFSPLKNTMVPDMMDGEMSPSDPDSRMDFLDPPEVVKRKIKKAFREEGNVTQNGLLAFAKVVLMHDVHKRTTLVRDG